MEEGFDDATVMDNMPAIFTVITKANCLIMLRQLFALSPGILHPLIRTVPSFSLLYRTMYGGLDHHTAVGVMPFHRQIGVIPR
ncbi:hypothetical protein DOE73_24985 [Paenibacillus dendritiformis]|nr:hypothetical protein DOE73_24985 [Paenibacillus dendritiformis]